MPLFPYKAEEETDLPKPVKTNAMRILEREGIGYQAHSYEASGPVDGVHAAQMLGVDPARVYKTLVTRSTGGYCVFVIPVAEELDLKAAARSVGAKAVSMLPLAELLPVTGYVRGGCSPVGMKKAFPTVIDESALALPALFVSAGKIGVQLEMSPGDLLRAAHAKTAPLILTKE